MEDKIFYENGSWVGIDVDYDQAVIMSPKYPFHFEIIARHSKWDCIVSVVIKNIVKQQVRMDGANPLDWIFSSSGEWKKLKNKYPKREMFGGNDFKFVGFDK